MADDNKGLKIVGINRFDKGLVTNVTNEALDDQALPFMKNFDFDNRLGLVRRLGYKNIMPDISTYTNFEGTQQGYFQFIGKPYGIDDLDQLFQFENHIKPKETETVQNVKLLAVSGKLYLVENNITGVGEVKESSIFIPENINWSRSLSMGSLDDTTINNNVSGNLILKVVSGASI